MQLSRSLMPLAAVAALAFAAPALADPITLDAGDVGQTFTLNYNGVVDGTTVSGLTASTTFTLTGVTPTSYTFDYSVRNTTSNPLDSRVSIFGFNTDPNISGATVGGTFNQTVTSSNVPGGIGTIDVCFKGGGGNNCAGGGSFGITDGNTGSGSLTLNFAQPITSLTLDDFFVRYQSINGGGFRDDSGVGGVTSTSTSTGGTTTSGGTPVPEPGMLGLLGAALAGLGLARRRRRPIPA